MMYAEEAWCYTTGSNNVRIAVLDDACDFDHPDLVNNVLYGYDFANLDTDPSPPVNLLEDQEHGTHVTGIISAEINNNIGMAGMTNNKIYFAKIWNDEGEPSAWAEIAALTEILANQNLVKVINMSYVSEAQSSTIQDVLQDLYYDNGVLLIAAAGNNGNSIALYPASHSYVISVGSLNSSLEKSNFSNYGNGLELMAPGGHCPGFETVGITGCAFATGNDGII